jgi:hypothetical protein
MKKNLFTILILLSAFEIFAQPEKWNYLIDVSGNYNKTTTENGVLTNRFTTKSNSLATDASMGYFFSSRFIAGIGVDYIHRNEQRQNILNTNYFIQAEALNIKAEGILPHIYFGYYLPITSKLYFNTNLKLSYGKIKSDYQSQLDGEESLNSGFFTSQALMVKLYNRNTNRSDNSEYFEAFLSPELSYFFTKSFGVYLGCGGISYSMYDWKTINSNWLISFDLNHWKIGIKIQMHSNVNP